MPLDALDRDTNLRALRPDVPVDIDEAQPVERFQHEVLRPLLKLQNDVILQLVDQFVQKYHTDYERRSDTDRRAILRNLLKQDSKLKRLLFGMIAGLFTREEFAFFLAHQGELRRRMVPLLIQRVDDQRHRLSATAPTS
ncbi:MAG: hypothetical protein GVY12_03975 [Bacteroidetes bacterium]|nr:hypothetical protein [Bacteroidota bacterium]